MQDEFTPPTTHFMISAAIVGASGYSGAELLRLLSAREDISLKRAFAASSAGKYVEDLYPVFSKTVDLRYEPFAGAKIDDVDVAFVALPSGEAMHVVPELLKTVNRVIDLGGDFRLRSAELYKQYYGHDHCSPGLLSEAVYGLPEVHRDSIMNGRLVANPGCYPTSALLPLIPLLKSGIISPEGIVINSLSGVSGAGRTSAIDFSFTEVNENIRAYKIGKHQHLPEMQSVLEQTTGKNISLSFVPHLVPINRGIFTTIHADLVTSISQEKVMDAYTEFYHDAPFVRIKQQIPQIKDVLRTNYCDIGFTIEPRTDQLIIVSVIDNLVKGAAGQAIQNMNIMFGLPQENGLR